ncbi:DHH family phosphoesterase [Metamycoplasma canadense]|uniref:DHH family phosphoesterase n=1 Tax=Metamycoplasma canadense TaxID=29554 RepID=A0A077L5N1_9BACT|nr:DHHA1 domain-containing protein [Metamycoplasma canadense]BAP39322.1 DHH family phosphoesterase [Metamycoplasma canadense]
MKKQFEQFWNILSQYEYITLCTHINPDGDTIGSAVAFKEIIQLNIPSVKKVEISGGDCPRNLNFLFDNHLSLVDQEMFDKSLKVVVDTSTVNRVYDKRVVAKESIKFDHHPVVDEFMFGIGGDYWPATGQLLTQMVIELNLKTNQKALQGLAVAIITDTAQFTERDITSTTFDAMSYLLNQGLEYKKVLQNLKLNNEEKKIIFNTISKLKIEGIVSYIVSEVEITNDIVRPLVNQFLAITNTEVSLVILKQKNNFYRCSIRSIDSYDVSLIAEKFGGGGHKNSAGFNIDSLDKLKVVLNEINNH